MAEKKAPQKSSITKATSMPVTTKGEAPVAPRAQEFDDLENQKNVNMKEMDDTQRLIDASRMEISQIKDENGEIRNEQIKASHSIDKLIAHKLRVLAVN